MQRHKKRQATACSLYSEPSSGDEVPVLTAYNVSWDASCVSLTGYTDSDGQIDLYLSVNYADSSDNADLGIVPVHVWTGIDLDAGSLETTLDQAWWNASDAGAGSVQAQFQIVPSTHELWDTPAGPGPLFTIAYNGTYPASLTSSAESAEYTGPSVESVSTGRDSDGLSSGELAAVVVVPLLAIFVALASYVTWQRRKKRESRKRWSAALEKRYSVMSSARPSMAMPRPSMAQSSGRPSMHQASPEARRSAYARQSSYFSNAPDMPSPNKRASTYSFGNAGTAVMASRPTSSYSSSPTRPFPSPPAPAHHRASRISFAEGASPRPSMQTARPSMSRHQTSKSISSQLRHESTYDVSPRETSPRLETAQLQTSPRLATSDTLASLAQSEYADAPEFASPSPSYASLPRRARPLSGASDMLLRRELASMPALSIVRDPSLASVYTAHAGPSTSLSAPELDTLAQDDKEELTIPREDSTALDPDAALARYAAGTTAQPKMTRSGSSVMRRLWTGLWGGSEGPTASPVNEKDVFEEQDEDKDAQEIVGVAR